jgi:hypothetical protein
MALLPARKVVIREIQRLHARRAPLNISAVKRNHPKLIGRVYAVRPFWGWKRALEDAGLDYKRINTELRDYVDCKICGRNAGTLPVHLLRKHNIAAKDYRLDYPDAETTCETLRAAIARRREHKRTPLPRWEEVWTPEYVLDRIAELRRRNFPLNLYWSSNHDPALAGKARDYFGSWDEALRRIGLDPERIRLAKPTEHLTAKQLIARLKKRRDELPKNSWPREKEDSPLANAARKYFGSWSAALRVAGIEPQGEKSHWPKANKAALLTEIRRRKRKGKSLLVKKVLREKWGRALLDRAATLFGSWTAARVAAGFDPPANAASPWTKADKVAIVEELRRRKKVRTSLSTRKVERSQWGHPLINRAKILFGSWGAALLAAGIDPPAGIMSPWAKSDKAAILAEIRRRKRARESLRYSEVERRKWGTPLLKRSETLFGSWNAALLAADSSVSRRRRNALR